MPKVYIVTECDCDVNKPEEVIPQARLVTLDESKALAFYASLLSTKKKNNEAAHKWNKKWLHTKGIPDSPRPVFDHSKYHYYECDLE